MSQCNTVGSFYDTYGKMANGWMLFRTLITNIQGLEKVQKFALQMCAKDYYASYQHLLELFCIPSLRNRWFYLSLYCIVNGLVHFLQLNIVHPPMSSSQNYNPHAYLVPHAQCNTLKFSFFSTVIQLWNSIPVEAYTSEHLLEFISPLFLSP